MTLVLDDNDNINKRTASQCFTLPAVLLQKKSEAAQYDFRSSILNNTKACPANLELC